MGIIQRQGLKHTIISYVGVAIGLISTLTIYPRVGEAYGLFQVLIGITTLLSSFTLLGLSSVVVKFFPIFKNDKNGHNGLLGFASIGTLIGCFLFILLYPLIRYLVLEFWYKDDPLLAQYFYLLIPFTIFFTFKNLLIFYTSNFHRIVVPNLIDQLLIKITLPILLLLFIGEYISQQNYVYAIIIHYAFVVIALIAYTWHLKQWHWQLNWAFLNKNLLKEIGDYAGFNILNLLAFQVAFRIDILMVGAMINISSSGIYAIVNIITQVISKPHNAIIAITNPLIADKWENNQLQEIDSIYKKSSTNLLLIGVYIFLGIWLSLDDLISIMPNSELVLEGKYVVLFIGISILIDMATSINAQIINFSKLYRFNLYAVLGLAILNIIFNLIFIPKWQLAGAALATLCSNFLYNLIKAIFIWVKFKMQPFSINTLKILVLTFLTFVIVTYCPMSDNVWINMLIRSILVSLIYGGLALTFQVSEDINGLLKKALDFIKK